MAGSTFKPPRPSGSVKRLMGVAQNQGVPASTPQNTRLQGPPGFQQPAPKTRVPNDVNAHMTTVRDKYDARPPARTTFGTAKPIAANPAPAERQQYTPAAPAPKPVNTNAPTGSGMVTTQGQQHTQDSRMGVNVGNQITVDNNQASPGAASQEYATKVRTTDPNSVYYKPPEQPNATVGQAAPEAPVQNTMQNVPMADENAEAVNKAGGQPAAQPAAPLPNPGGAFGPIWNSLSREQQQTVSNLGKLGQGGSDIATSSRGLAAQPATQPAAQPAVTRDSLNQEYVRAATRLANATNGAERNAALAAMGEAAKKVVEFDKKATEAKQVEWDAAHKNEPLDPVTGLRKSDNDAVTVPGRDQSGNPKYDQVPEGARPGSPTPNEVAERYNIPPDQARYYLEKRYIFDMDPENPLSMWTPDGDQYDGSEVTDALSKHPTDPTNAMTGRATYDSWADEVAGRGAHTKADQTQGALDTATSNFKAELDKPTDTTAIAEGFDRNIAAQRQLAARNRALALQAIQERGAYSGASVNQMMGQQTETGYAYDTQNQAQETALQLQKEMEISNAKREDANRKINFAMMLYNGAKTDKEKSDAWGQYLMQKDIAEQEAMRQSNLQQQMNSPSLGMTLAKVGVGVAGAVLAPYTGGASLLAAGAIGAGMGAMDNGTAAYSAYRNAAPGSMIYGGKAPGVDATTRQYGSINLNG